MKYKKYRRKNVSCMFCIFKPQEKRHENVLDNVGNRTIRKVLETGPAESLLPQDSLPPLTSPPPQDITTTLTSLTSLMSLESTAEVPP